VVDWAIRFMERHGYSAVTFLMFLENVVPPIPSELIMPLAGYIAAQGGLSLGWTIACGTLGSVAGASLWYFAGRKLGAARLRRIVARHGKWLALSCDDMERSEAWFERRGKLAVLVARLVPGIRTYVGVPAGIQGMPLGAYLLYSGLGSAVWTALLALVGWWLRSGYAEAGKYLGRFGDAVLWAALAYMAWRYIRQWWAARQQN
jgi:membrane protein DedA with SNARE-associated domain